jgi:hypothetical protein
MYFVRIELGPCSSGSAQAWIAYATEMLEVLRGLSEDQLPPRVLDAFAALLDEWRPIAQRSTPFRWSSDEPPERAQYLLNALYRAGLIIEREAASGRAQLRPASADEFMSCSYAKCSTNSSMKATRMPSSWNRCAMFGASPAAIDLPFETVWQRPGSGRSESEPASGPMPGDRVGECTSERGSAVLSTGWRAASAAHLMGRILRDLL